MNFLLKTKLKEILEENLNREFNISISLFDISKNIEHYYIPKTIINNTNNFIKLLNEKLIIIIKGNITLNKYSHKISEFTIEEFLKYLNNIKKTEYYLYKEILKFHKTFEILNLDNYEKYRNFFLQKKLKDSFDNEKNKISNFTIENKSEIFKILKDYGEYDKENISLDIKELEKISNFIQIQSSTTGKIIPKLENKFYNTLKNSLFFSKEFINDIPDKEKEFLDSLNIYESKFYKVLKQNHIKTYMESDIINQEDIYFDNESDFPIFIFNEETNFAIMEKKLFYENILSEKKKLRISNCQFLFDLIFDKFLIKKNFEIKYFDNFKYGELNKGDVIYKENDKVDYVYFIIEGQLDLNIKKNLFTIYEDLLGFIELHEEFSSNF
jgi:hypothetical protein